MWLKTHLKIDFNLNEKNIYAVGDRIKNYPGKNDSERKLKVLIEYRKTSKYNRIKLIDDNKTTIDLIKLYNFEYIHC